MGWRRSLSTNVANATAALSRLATCAMQASDALFWVVVCRGVVDGIEPVIHETRTPEGPPRYSDGPRRRLRRAGEPLDGRVGLVADLVVEGGRVGRTAADVAPVGVLAEASAETRMMSRHPARALTAGRGGAPPGGVVLRTLADHRPFVLVACCVACGGHVVLEHAALAARFGWDAPLDELRRRMTCRRWSMRRWPPASDGMRRSTSCGDA